MKYLLPIFLGLSLCFQACNNQSRVLLQDMSFMYNPDSPVLKHKVLFENDSIFLFLSLSKNEKFKNFDSFRSRYTLSGHKTNAYSDGEVIKLDSVPIKLRKFWDLKEQVILQYSVQGGEPEDIFFVRIEDKSRLQIHLLDLGYIYQNNSPGKTFVVTDMGNNPLIDTYFQSSANYKIESDVKFSDTVFYHFYKHDFPPADPPYLVNNPNPVVQKIIPDSAGRFENNIDFNFTGNGVLILTAGQHYPGCASFLLKDNQYPILSNSTQLVEPLVYLTSETEYKKLLTSDDQKLALDNFWMEIGGSMEYSRRLVQFYYSRVEFANRFFTSYKEGWKTDRGMVYIIMGKPDFVTKSGQDEIWQYDQIFNKEFVTFTFQKKPIFLSDDNYELQRSENFKKLWDVLIDNWRKGIIIKNSNL